MAAHSYKKSTVYQKNKQLTLNVFKYFRKRRLTGITKFLRFISIARGSAFEADYWLEIIIELNLFPKEDLILFVERNQESVRLLTTMMKRLEGKS